MLNLTLHGYTIRKHLNSGGMADVFYAENSLGKKAAIKVLKPEYNTNENISERFTNEAKTMVQLVHPNICQVLDLGMIDGRPAIVMEYLEGQTLKEVITNPKIKVTNEQLHDWFGQITSGLQYAHDKEIIHRDIKPSNLFLTNEGSIKILDFGIAKTNESVTQTITGQTLGTIMYMSPEQVEDPKRVNNKTDFYSLGVTFYHLLSGKPPYDSSTDSSFKIQSKIVRENLDLSVVPEGWKELLGNCLQKNPLHRSLQNIPFF